MFQNDPLFGGLDSLPSQFSRRGRIAEFGIGGPDQGPREVVLCQVVLCQDKCLLIFRLGREICHESVGDRRTLAERGNELLGPTRLLQRHCEPGVAPRQQKAVLRRRRNADGELVPHPFLVAERFDGLRVALLLLTGRGQGAQQIRLLRKTSE